MLDELDIKRDTGGGTPIHVVGWYHTHPGELDVFMSSVDRHTQEKLFSEDWQFAIVLNPQRAEWRAFNGRAAEECRGVWLAPAPF
jgi:proteasome lid subunit RPN8/RPN11